MATFTVEITPDSSNGTIAHAVGKFSGGSSSYKGQRRMDVAVSGVGTFSALSPETSGGENTFSLDITGLTPGTTYNWSASLYYKNTSVGWVTAGSQYDKSGSLTTKSGTPALPSGYTKLEYIESDNSSYLDTGVTMGKTDSVTLEEVLSPFGTSDTRYTGANGYMQIAINSSGYSINGTAKKALGTKDKLKCVYTPTTESLYINGDLVESSNWSSYNGAAVKIGLFKMGDAGNAWYSSKAHSGKCYGASIIKNGVKVREFIPCKNASGVAGMWDDVSKSFFSSASSFAFTAGSVCIGTHKTLVNGTVYQVKGGKCLVNGTVYNILKGRTLIGGTGYDINFEPDVSLTWYFNETIDITSQPDKFWGYSSGIAVSFVSGYYGFTYDHLIRGYDDTYGVRTLIYYRKITETRELAYRNGWRGQVYRTITFDELPTGDLLTWLQANATPQ